MNWSYTYDPRIWPALITIGVMVFLAIYSWQRRKLPAAKPFAIGSLFAVFWAFGTVLEISAVDFSTGVFWVKFQVVWQLPTATAFFCFILEYAGLGRWLTRRNLILLTIPVLLVAGLIITNDYHLLMWTGFRMDGHIRPIPGAVNRIFVGYAYLLALSNFIVLLWLAIRSPQHRRPVALMLFGQIIGRGVYLLDYIFAGVLGSGESILMVLGFLSSTYAIALFHFHVFDPVPLARSTVIEQMSDGMLVMDLKGIIVDLNQAAEKIIGMPGDRLKEQFISNVLPLNSNLLDLSTKTGSAFAEITLGKDKSIHYYGLNLTLLNDRRNHMLGYLLLIHDVTEQRQAQDQILEQKQVVATLKERERLARELHDSIGQVLGYVNLQAQAIQKWVQAGNNKQAEVLLTRLADVARGAHTDVRESILSLKAGSGQEWAFLPTLSQYLSEFQSHYGIQTELSISKGSKEVIFETRAEVQLLRVIQEALNNAHKHSGARTIRVAINQEDSRGYITISDDGSGFDLNHSNQDSGAHFGLSFMKERMSEIGGSLTIDSQPGAGTVIRLEAPIRTMQEMT
jgi:PAS domain S-box-containing protein